MPIGTEPLAAAAETLAGTYFTAVLGMEATFLMASRYLRESRYFVGLDSPAFLSA